MVRSCNKLHATHEIVNARKRLNNVPRVVHSCIKLHATPEIVNHVPCVVLSCIKMQATPKIANNVRILNEMPEIGLKPTQKMLILQKKA